MQNVQLKIYTSNYDTFILSIKPFLFGQNTFGKNIFILAKLFEDWHIFWHTEIGTKLYTLITGHCLQ